MDDQEYTLFGKPIERLKGSFCEKCADLWKEEQYLLCYTCHNEMDTLHFGIIRAPGVYKPEKNDGNYLSKIITCFKYNDAITDSKRQEIAEEFANILYQYVLDESEIIDDIDCLVPIPMTESKEKKKGFNHAKMIAEKFSGKVGIRVEYDNLIKIRETESQTSLSRAERRENVKDAFDVVYPHKFKEKKVLLIDDIATTCATIDECAKMLKNAGAQKVNALVLARDTKPKGDSDE